MNDVYYFKNIEKLIDMSKSYDISNLYGIFCIRGAQYEYFTKKIHPILDYIQELDTSNREQEIYAQALYIADCEGTGFLELKHFAVNYDICGQLKELILSKISDDAVIYDSGHIERSPKIK